MPKKFCQKPENFGFGLERTQEWLSLLANGPNCLKLIGMSPPTVYVTAPPVVACGRSQGPPNPLPPVSVSLVEC